jgi:hypothetical protein
MFDAMVEQEPTDREKKKNSPYCGGSSSSSRRCGVLFICSDKVAITGSVVYVLGGYVPEFYGSSKGGNCSEVLPKLSDGAATGLFYLARESLQKHAKRARVLLQLGRDTWRQRSACL